MAGRPGLYANINAKRKRIKGAKNPKAREAEIKRTSNLYKKGKLTPAMMDRISKRRSKS